MATLPMIQYPDMAGQAADMYKTGYAVGDTQRRNRLMVDAGKLASSGQMPEAKNTLLAGGDFQQADQLQNSINTMQDRDLAHAATVQQHLSNIASTIRTPQDFDKAKQVLGRMGLPVDGFSYDMLPTLKAQALSESDRYNRALTERKMAMEQRQQQQPKTMEVGGNLVRVSPQGEATEIYHGQPQAGKFSDKIVMGKDADGNPIAMVQTPNGIMRLDPNSLPMMGGNPGQSNGVVGTAMNPDVRKALAKQGVAELSKQQEMSAAAQTGIASLDELQNLRNKSGGLSGRLYNNGVINTAVTRFLGRNLGGGVVIPSSDQANALQAQDAAAVGQQMELSKGLKGAISDYEGRMLSGAVPGSNMTDEAASLRMSAQRAIYDRQQQKTAFYEQWLAHHGNSLGSETAWQKYTRDNPIIKFDASGNVKSVDDRNIGNWQGYVTGSSPTNYQQSQPSQPSNYDPLGILGN